MRDRLTALCKAATEEGRKYFREHIQDSLKDKHCFSQEQDCTKSIYDIEADYLIAHGVVVLPCKVGDTVFFPCGGEIHEKKIVCFITYGYTTVAFFNAQLTESCEVCDFGKIVFLTREEAEAKL